MRAQQQAALEVVKNIPTPIKIVESTKVVEPIKVPKKKKNWLRKKA